MHCVPFNKISVKSTFSLANNAEIDFTKVFKCNADDSTTELQILRKNKHFSVKLTILTKEFISRKYFQRDTEWKSRQKQDRNLCFYGKRNTFFRQINVFTKVITKELISRKFLSVITFHTTFHTVRDRVL